jgi:sterol desaturase/sphingolipid hydroxylase (fatty acid hydroxylase superfamily)
MPKMRPQTRSLTPNAALFIAVPIFTVILLVAHHFIREMPIYEWILKYIYLPSFKILKRTIFTPLFVIGFALILILERFIPANPKQKTFHVGLFQDAIYLVLISIMKVTVILAYVKLLESVYKSHFSFLTIHSLQQFPFAIRFLIAILTADFLGWLHHLLRHKIGWLWHFHAIHHSQKNLNLFTDLRYHILEYFFTQTVKFIPLLMISAESATIGAYAIGHQWYSRLYHANIQSNFGLLRYIFVTPQSHRIHHSVLTQHHDSNYGVIFSIWDRMFGTQHSDFRAYPETGIDDESFPHESSERGFQPFTALIQQHIYPFRAIRRSLKQTPAVPAL